MNLDQLITAGFALVGAFIADGGGELDVVPSGDLAMEDVVYLFAQDDDILYVGMTEMTLDRRLYGYRHPGPTQSTNIRLHDAILDELEEGGSVEIYAAAPGDSAWRGLPVAITPGLEAGLIDELKPPWNTR